MPENTPLRMAYTLEKGTKIRLLDQELTITHVAKTGDWVEFSFEKPYWEPLRERWLTRYGCHFGFCFQIVED